MAQRIVINVQTGEQTVGEYTPEPYTPPPPAPIVVSPRQIRHALLIMNLRTQVEEAVATADQTVKDWWGFATAFEENHPMITAMAIGLGVTDEARHDLFVLAASL